MKDAIPQSALVRLMASSQNIRRFSFTMLECLDFLLISSKKGRGQREDRHCEKEVWGPRPHLPLLPASSAKGDDRRTTLRKEVRVGTDVFLTSYRVLYHYIPNLFSILFLWS